MRGLNGAKRTPGPGVPGLTDEPSGDAVGLINETLREEVAH